MEITKQRLMNVLDHHFQEAGIKITVGRYNKMLSDLGFPLEEKRTCFHCGKTFMAVIPPGPPDIPPHVCDSKECREARARRLRREVG